jgi:SH3 domain protein
MHKCPRACICAILALIAISTAHAETLYVTDVLTVPVRRGPSNGHKIVIAALPSGTSLDVLGRDEAAGYTQIRTPNGTEGWIPTQYLVAEPAAKDRLTAATKRIQSLESELASLKDTLQQSRKNGNESENRNSDLSKRTKQLEGELTDIKRVSANAVATYEENQTLKKTNEDLSSQVTRLTTTVHSLEGDVQTRWLGLGGGLVVIGLILGVMIKSRPKKRTWS